MLAASLSLSAPLPRLSRLCPWAMLSLAIATNLLPVFLTSLGTGYSDTAGLTQEERGRLSALSFAGLVTGNVVTGPLAERRGAKLVAPFGHLLISAALLGAAFARTYAALGFALFLLGFGGGALDMVLSPVFAALHPVRAAAALNWLHAFYCIGAVLTIMAGAALLHLGLGWRSACLALLPVPAALLAAFAPLEFPTLHGDRPRTLLPDLIRSRGFAVALAGIFLAGATELGVAQWLPAYSERALRFPPSVGSGALLLFSLAMAGGRLAIGVRGGRGWAQG